MAVRTYDDKRALYNCALRQIETVAPSTVRCAAGGCPVKDKRLSPEQGLVITSCCASMIHYNCFITQFQELGNHCAACDDVNMAPIETWEVYHKAPNPRAPADG